MAILHTNLYLKWNSSKIVLVVCVLVASKCSIKLYGIYIIKNKYYFTETLRKYAVVPVLHRNCVKDYKIAGTNKIIEKGVQIFIPAFPLQRDEQYYPEPEKFKPERFNEDNPAGKNLSNRPYLPFGEGNNFLHSYITINYIFIQRINDIIQ